MLAMLAFLALIANFLLYQQAGEYTSKQGVEDVTHITLSIAGRDYTVEYAYTDEARQKGLMYRQSLCEDCGMLFNFGKTRDAAMWMKNTYIKLSVAYITESGEVVGIENMMPHDLTPVRASQPVRYAWEMHQGWFDKHNIRIGDTLSIRVRQ